MSDIASDFDSAILLVEQAENELLEKDKNSPLIAYLSIADDKERDIAWQTLLRMFSKNPSQEGNVKGAMELTFALSMYLLALETALGKRAPKSDKQTQKTSQQNDFEDSVPF